jgi:pimeloyl-ACP methyl ester carboxylesterase
MPRAKSNGIEIEYETFGNHGDPAMLLISGWSVQMLSWNERFCRLLADLGLFVIRFDNRDVGLSTHLHGVEADTAGAMAAFLAGDPVPPMPYDLSDMANDSIGLLDALGVGKAHVVGASMGGMIAQTISIEYPHRVLSLVSIMSSTGEPGYGQAAPEATEALMVPPPTEREAYGEHIVRIGRVIGSKTHFDPDALRARAVASFDRCFDPDGALRQMGAPFSSGAKRAEHLPTLRVPTLVIHGRQDSLIAPDAGERTAELIPGAQLLLLDDAGHDLPEPLWPEIVAAVGEHVRRAAPHQDMAAAPARRSLLARLRAILRPRRPPPAH